jgi:hypothetical protein
MTTKQLVILNSLVTFAAENVPGGLSEDEREVARIVGAAALIGSEMASQDYNYKTVNASLYQSIAAAANHWSAMGWRVVGVASDTRPGYSHALLLERPVGVSHPDD